MKEHLIKKKKDNKFLTYTHRIILGALITILIYEFIFKYKKEKYFFLSFEQINLYINIIYYLLCVVYELNKKETKKLFHRFFHFCFSLSVSTPITFLVIYFSVNNEDIQANSSMISISFLLTPMISNILETLIIKRYKPAYINFLFIIIFFLSYYGMIHFLGRMEMDIGFCISEQLKEATFVIQLFMFSLIGAFGGWYIYKSVTKPKIKKINIDSSVDSNEMSEESK
jgi:hypothetical protein